MFGVMLHHYADHVLLAAYLPLLVVIRFQFRLPPDALLLCISGIASFI